MKIVDWIEVRVAAEFDLNQSGIYLWTIGHHTYVGKATKLRSRYRRYLRNVAKIESGRPYLPSNPDGFRQVHRELFSAKQQRALITWQVLELADPGVPLLEAERRWIKTLKPDLNGKNPARSGSMND